MSQVLTIPANKLLATLPSEERQRINAHLTAVPLTFKQVLYKQGEAIREVYFPGSGATKHSLSKLSKRPRATRCIRPSSDAVAGCS